MLQLSVLSLSRLLPVLEKHNLALHTACVDVKELAEKPGESLCLVERLRLAKIVCILYHVVHGHEFQHCYFLGV